MTVAILLLIIIPVLCMCLCNIRLRSYVLALSLGVILQTVMMVRNEADISDSDIDAIFCISVLLWSFILAIYYGIVFGLR